MQSSKTKIFANRGVVWFKPPLPSSLCSKMFLFPFHPVVILSFLPPFSSQSQKKCGNPLDLTVEAHSLYIFYRGFTQASGQTASIGSNSICQEILHGTRGGIAANAQLAACPASA